MKNQLESRYVLSRSALGLLIAFTIFFCPGRVVAQSSGTVVNVCSDQIVDDVQGDQIEETVCLYGNPDVVGFDATLYNDDADAQHVAGLGLDAVANFEDIEPASVYQLGTQEIEESATYTPSLDATTYIVNVNASECVDPTGTGDTSNCIWNYDFASVSASAGYTGRPPSLDSLTATPGDGQITLSWDPVLSTTGGATGYEIWFNGGADVWDTVDANTYTYTVTGLTNGTSYSAYIVADGIGTSNTVTAIPAPPQKIPTQTSVTLSPTTMTLGQVGPQGGDPVVANVVVTPSLATGNVSCFVGGTQIGSTVALYTTTPYTGTVTIGLPGQGLPVGNDVITCQYAGNASYQSSAGSATETVINASPSIPVGVSVATTSPSFGQFNVATVTVTSTDNTIPTGIINLFDGQTVIGGSTLNGGVGKVVISNLAPGVHNLVATYFGDATHPASAGVMSGQVSVSSGSPATTVILSPARILAGDQITALASVTNAPGLTPVGSASCSTPGGAAVTQALNSQGTAKIVLPAIAMGTSTVTCVYTSSVNSDTSSGSATVTAMTAGIASGTSMSADRAFHAAASLPNGDILVVGGEPQSAYLPLSSAEIFSASSASFQTTGSMHSARMQFGMTVMSDGTVLVSGGDDGSINDPAGLTAEYYDPSDSQFKSVGSMGTSRYLHTLTSLDTASYAGMALVAGGKTSGGSATASAELYSSATTSFSATGAMQHPRWAHAAILLPNGKVFVSGGFDGSNALTSTELFDPSSGQFSSGPTMQHAREFHTATLLPGGQVLLAGGDTGYQQGMTATSEIYDPTSNSISPGPSMSTARTEHTATLLANGDVLIAGGLNSQDSSIASIEIYNPSTNAFASGGSLSTPRYGDTATSFASGEVLFTGGGSYPTNLSSTDLYSYDNDEGIADIKYQVVGITYAPPGSGSTVTYGASSTLGSTNTIDEDTNLGVTVTVKAGGGAGLQVGTVGASAGSTGSYSTGYSYDTDSSSTYSLQEVTSNTVVTPGPLNSGIGVDHDYDLISIWLDPQVDLTTFNNGTTGIANWTGLSYQGCDVTHTSRCDANNYGQADIITMPVLCLKIPYNPSCSQYLVFTTRAWDSTGSGGLNAIDYQNILANDPFVPDPNYDPQVDTRFNYESGLIQYPPGAPGQGPQTYTGSLQSTATNTTQQIIAQKYTTGFTIDTQVSGGFLADFGDDFSVATTASWTHKDTSLTSTSKASQATYSVKGPVSTDNYAGPISFNSWHDNIFGAFMFFSPDRPTVNDVTLIPNMASLTFGTVNYGTDSATQTLTITNTNSSGVSVVMGLVSGSQASSYPPYGFTTQSFSIVSGSDQCTGVTLAAGASCTVGVKFSPVISDLPNAGANSVNGSLTIAGVELASGSTNILLTTSVSLSGTGDR